MEDEKQQTISLRIPEETYEALKKYAEEHGESVSDVVRGLIDGLLSGAQTPDPPGQVAIPPEILELPGKFQAMLQYEVEIRQCVVGLSGQVGELQKAVRGILAVLFPGMPLPPWGVMSAVDSFEMPGMGDGGKVP